ncbi:MAG: imidazole glycerol phosphate synthase subunit HisH [Cyclobacteriaceae bacterium]|jgi:glutamine amidotransferase|nr:imidazole glycerol phosphate synthase subunit HisH [Flammeovirgaceae bacterium]
MRIAVIRYNAGNIQSVSYALERLGASFEVTSDPEKIQTADKVIFPGVGEASTTMRFLQEKGLNHLIMSLQQPVLGVCLGMQLLCRFSEENDTTCLGVFPVDVRKFGLNDNLKVPHMGWNSLDKISGWLPAAIQGKFTYFVHSFYVPVNAWTVAETQYGIPFSAAMRKDNFFAVQFHPEKSAQTGEKILQAFLNV